MKTYKHTKNINNKIKELYTFRRLYNAMLFNEWAKTNKFNVHKSMRHSN